MTARTRAPRLLRAGEPSTTKRRGVASRSSPRGAAPPSGPSGRSARTCRPAGHLARSSRCCCRPAPARHRASRHRGLRTATKRHSRRGRGAPTRRPARQRWQKAGRSPSRLTSPGAQRLARRPAGRRRGPGLSRDHPQQLDEPHDRLAEVEARTCRRGSRCAWARLPRGPTRTRLGALPTDPRPQAGGGATRAHRSHSTMIYTAPLPEDVDAALDAVAPKSSKSGARTSR